MEMDFQVDDLLILLVSYNGAPSLGPEDLDGSGNPDDILPHDVRYGLRLTRVSQRDFGPLRLFSRKVASMISLQEACARIIDLTFRCLTRFRFHLHSDVFANATLLMSGKPMLGMLLLTAFWGQKAGSGMMSMAARFLCNECVKGECQWGLA